MTKAVGLYRCENGWKVRWFGEYKPDTGKQKRYSRKFAKMKDAVKFKKAKEKEMEQGAPRDLSTATLKEYAEQWLKDKTINDDLRPATVLLYELTMKRLYNHFGPDMLIRNINRKSAKTFLANLKPIKGDKKLGSWSRHRVIRQCKTLFKEAVKDGTISTNPFNDIAKPKCSASDWYYLKVNEYMAILDVTPTLREKVLYALAYTCGLRESEALALYWTNIDFGKKHIRIASRPETDDYPPFEVKDSDVRTIPLPDMTVDLLTPLLDKAPKNGPFVLMDEQGCQRIRKKWQQCRERDRHWLNRYWSNNVIRNFHRRVRWAKIDNKGKELTVHVLRKCCCQNWANNLPMNVVKEFMGHSSIDTTEKFYSNVDADHFEKAKDTMNELLKPTTEKAGAGMTDPKLTFSGKKEQKKDVA